MLKLHTINLVNGLILVVLGLIAYFTPPSSTFTALIAPAAGVVLMLFTRPLMLSNQFAEHTVAALTLLLGLLFALRINIDNFEWTKRNILLLLMALSCFITVFFFVRNFVREWRQGKTGL
ncbi:MAG: hypothetical protein LPJ89_11495 [Hymenobacteraceae bacterium]|nr:hypothetical protein [Hymenobacteraceae bacterium]MDX5396730.1 hypothetical protein [Hymenobacteraceae bacterium]MDX5444390.1 hypothetical protein [Hymenobacteraceae bacterium]MDX5512790.1 hypothetical protein [Hymenobacteraceae bacterium]